MSQGFTIKVPKAVDSLLEYTYLVKFSTTYFAIEVVRRIDASLFKSVY